jgi:hypothetical protein
MAFEDFLSQRADIYLQSESLDSTGGLDRDPTRLVHAQEPCLERPLDVAQTTDNDRDGSTRPTAFYFGRDLGLTSRHEIHVDGRVYRVVGTRNFNQLDRVIKVDATYVVG